MTSALRVSGLGAGYDAADVVTGVDLHVEPGEVVALLGANGAGKTTTLLGVAGLLRPRTGQVEVGGVPVSRRAAWRISRAGLTLVPEGRSLFTQLTAGENLRLAARRRGPSLGEVLANFPALEPILGRKAGQLSGGEQQMLAIARGLLTGPRVLLVDELSLGLAPLVVRNLTRCVREAADSSGIGVLVVEQHVQLVLDVADRAYVMRRGQIVLDAPAGELRHDKAKLAEHYLGAQAVTAGA